MHKRIGVSDVCRTNGTYFRSKYSDGNTLRSVVTDQCQVRVADYNRESLENLHIVCMDGMESDRRHVP